MTGLAVPGIRTRAPWMVAPAFASVGIVLLDVAASFGIFWGLSALSPGH